MIKPIQGPSRQTIGIPVSDGSSKEPAYVQTPERPEISERSEPSKNQFVGEAMLQGNLRAAELNASFKGEIIGIEPVVDRDSTNYFLPEVNDEVLTKKRE